MRVVFCMRPFFGHLHPMLSTASALRRRGHDVAFATAHNFEGAVAATGMPFLAAGLDPRAPPRDDTASRDWGESVTRRKLTDLLAHAAEHPPDVIVREQTDFAGLLAAEALGVPCATLGPALFIPSRSWSRLLDGMLDRIRADYGLAPDTHLERLHPDLYLDVVPASWQLPEAAQVEVLHRIRPVAALDADDVWEPPWPTRAQPRPMAYVTLGTVYNRRPRLFKLLVEGAAAAGLDVVATTGPDQDPQTLGIAPSEHVQLYQWLPQLAVMGHCRLVVAHGGFSTVMGALAHGRPLLVVPLGSDNPVHARRCRQLGVGLTLRVGEVERERVRRCVESLVGENRWRTAAERLRDEIAALPTADTGAALIERLAEERRGLVSDRLPPRAAKRERGRIAVVIPVFGREDLVRALLSDIAGEPWVEVVVVDNAGGYEPLGTERVLCPGSNLGWAAGCNHGLTTLVDDDHEAYVLLNSDTRLSPGFFDGLRRAWKATGAAVTGPVYDGVWPYQASSHRGPPASYRARARHRAVPFLEGTCLFLPRETVERTGLLDADSFPRHGWGVDFDYALRARADGRQVCVTELAYLHHERNGSQGDGWQLAAWDEMVSGMRRKWGQAWPSRLRTAGGRAIVHADGPSSPRTDAPAIFVLGARGSGASTATRLMELMGVAPPPADVECALDQTNAVLAGDAEIVAEPFEALATETAMKELAVARAKLRDLVPDRAWQWQDERNDVLLPFWAAALDVRVLAVLVIRDPAEMAASVHTRLGWPYARALAVWERSIRHVVRNVVGLPALVTPYDELLDDPAGWTARAEAFLRRHGVTPSVSVDPEAIRPLRRRQRTADATAVTPSTQQRRLFALLTGAVGVHDAFPELRLPAETPDLNEQLRAGDACADDGPSRLVPEWAEWVIENRRRGRTAQVLQVLVEHGLSPAQARSEVARLEREGTEPAYRSVNRTAWSELVAQGSQYTLPYGPAELAVAPELLEGPLELPWGEIDSVLCLASGGGQQGPLFASLGRHVTVADLSAEQLRRDRDAAFELGLEIECVELDMLDLHLLHGRRFDLVYQPVSTCYIPDVRALHEQVAAVLRPGGRYWVEHWNPTHMQLEGLGRWSSGGYRLVRPQIATAPAELYDAPGDLPAGSCWHFIHTLQHLLGTLTGAGFVVEAFAERRTGDPAAPPGSDEHLDAFVPPLFAVLARLEGDGR